MTPLKKDEPPAKSHRPNPTQAKRRLEWGTRTRSYGAATARPRRRCPRKADPPRRMIAEKSGHVAGRFSNRVDVGLRFQLGQRQTTGDQVAVLVHHFVHFAIQQDAVVQTHVDVASLVGRNCDVGGAVVGDCVVPLGLAVQFVRALQIVEENLARHLRLYRGAK